MEEMHAFSYALSAEYIYRVFETKSIIKNSINYVFLGLWIRVFSEN